MSPAADKVVDQAMQVIDRAEVPKPLQDSIDQHQRNLTGLAGALLEGGQDVEQVRQTITTVLDSFRDEILRTIVALREDTHAL